MKTDFKLNGTTIKRPDDFNIERYKVTKATRLADASMAMEFIAHKRKFYFTWNAITATELNKILAIIWDTAAVFFTLSYVESNVTKTATVYAGSIPTRFHRSDDGDWVWKDVTINFIER